METVNCEKCKKTLYKSEGKRCEKRECIFKIENTPRDQFTPKYLQQQNHHAGFITIKKG
jgi:hypothetical protein